jgi:hypothetical protein
VNGSTGLGLIIAQRIVNTMGGDLRVSSAPHRGTSFTFELIVPSAADEDALPSNIVEHASGSSTPIRAQRKHGFALAVPPESDRRELAVLAKNGRLTDIERWIENMINAHPTCVAFLTDIRGSLEALDFAAIEARALAPHETYEGSRAC